MNNTYSFRLSGSETRIIIKANGLEEAIGQLQRLTAQPSQWVLHWVMPCPLSRHSA